MQHTATHCNTSHHTAPHYTTLHHTAPHCKTHSQSKRTDSAATTRQHSAINILLSHLLRLMLALIAARRARRRSKFSKSHLATQFKMKKTEKPTFENAHIETNSSSAVRNSQKPAIQSVFAVVLCSVLTDENWAQAPCVSFRPTSPLPVN